MIEYTGSCHCAAVKFKFSSAKITSGLRCNCSMCGRRGALMTPFVLAPGELVVELEEQGLLKTYRFGSGVAAHHFCQRCGVYPFHQTMRKPGHYRVNLGCIEGLNPLLLPTEVFDGRAL